MLGLLPIYNFSPSCMQNQGRKYVLYPCNAVPVFFSQVTKDKETVSREQQNIGFLEALKPEEKV